VRLVETTGREGKVKKRVNAKRVESLDQIPFHRLSDSYTVILIPFAGIYEQIKRDELITSAKKVNEK